MSDSEGYVKCHYCGGPVSVLHDIEALKDRLNVQLMRAAPPSVMKYFEFYPLESCKNAVSLGEGGTPLLECKRLSSKLGIKLFVKNEGANPTGSFKDRGTLVELTKAIEMGASAVAVASTGNMAASVSAYASKAGLPCYVVVPDGTPLGKLCQTLSLGGRMLQVKGNYSDAVRMSEEMMRGYGYQLMGDYAFRAEGQKSCGFEIADQTGIDTPDYVVVPMGVGTNLAAIHKGFAEFLQVGLVKGMPKMVGVEAEGANAIVRAYRTQGEVRAMETDTVCGAINVSYPYDGPKALEAMKRSGGFALDASDDETLVAQQALAKDESIFCEPSSATVIAALFKAVGDGRVERGSKVVCVLTGNGLKDPDTAIRGLSVPPSIRPDYSEVKRFIDGGLYNLRAPVKKVDKETVVFEAMPSVSQLSDLMKSVYSANLRESELLQMRSSVGHFLSKGKRVTKSDLAAMLQETMSCLDLDNALSVEDFTFSSGSAQKSTSTVRVRYLEKTTTETAEGDGPVDSTVNAVKKAVGNGRWFHLTDYKVNIDVGGTEATVSVVMSVSDDEGNKATVRGASPDVIVASVRAFEHAFNALYTKRKSKAANEKTENCGWGGREK